MQAREYHERTKHTPLSVRSGGHYLDWYNRPLPFKWYPDLEPIQLPAQLPESADPAGDVLSGRSSAPPVRLDLAQLARLLFYSAGVTRPVSTGGGTQFYRAAPSAGALYPVEVYVVCGELHGLAAGVYHFEPIEFAVRRLRDGDLRAALAAAVADDRLARAPASVVLTGTPSRTTWKYRERGYRHLFWDAGTMLANLLALAESAGIGARVAGGFVDAQLSALVDVSPPQEFPLAVVSLGTGEDAPAAAPAPPVGRLGLRVHPLSAAPIDDPLIAATHAAGDLREAAAVAAWRRGAPHAAVAARGQLDVPDAPPTEGSIEDVILRRGSARRFSRAAVPGRVLRWALGVASRPVEADSVTNGASLVSQLVAVHAVDGVEPGAYRWRGDELDPIHRDVSRDRSAYLCLEQALGGDSAATVFHVSDLDAVLDALGERGYRVAQLEAGIACGRLHLAAYAAGIGASGLTFYDDEVRTDFRTREEPMLVTAIGVPGYRSRPGHRTSEQPPVRLAAG